MTLSEVTTGHLRAAGLDPQEVRTLVRAALAEDLRYGLDVTTEATVLVDAIAEAAFRARPAGVVAGIPVARAVLDEVLGADGYKVLHSRDDGDMIMPGESALSVHAPVRGLLTAERTALNLLCHLSGIATATAEWVRAVEGTGCRIRDSRKTLPGLRVLQKYAVRCGGGVNHRMSLGDAILIKDNHVHAAGSVGAALAAAREHSPALPCEVEVDSFAQLEEVLPLGVELVLLDNFSADECAAAARRRDAVAPDTGLEASGGLEPADAAAYAAAGVDFLAVGGLTHSSSVLDIGLDLD